MIHAGWDRKDPLFRRVFTSMMIPDAREEQMVWLDELHQRSASARTAYESRIERGARMPPAFSPSSPCRRSSSTAA